MQLIHTPQCAKRHSLMQVPNDTLMKMPFGSLSQSMSDDFKAALEWHIAQHNTKIADLAAGTGVSRDIINKVRLREKASTSVENAVLIAAYYGKTVNDFLAKRPATETSRMRALLDLLSTEDRRLLEAQIRGLIQHRVEPE